MPFVGMISGMRSEECLRGAHGGEGWTMGGCDECHHPVRRVRTLRLHWAGEVKMS
jgi:hypothetical protein